MKLYNVDEAFELLKKYKITTHKESVRRWLREGKIKGVAPTAKRNGWTIKEEDLYHFIHSRLPDHMPLESLHHDETNEIHQQIENKIRAEIWWILVHKNIFEDYLEIRKKDVQEAMKHLRMSKEFEVEAWSIISRHKRGYQTPRVPYILDAFLFENERVLMDDNYEILKEKIMFALIEHLRKKRVSK